MQGDLQLAQACFRGLSVHAPAGSDSVELMVNAAQCGRSLISEVPLARWDVAAITEGRANNPQAEGVANRMRHGGFVIGAQLCANAWFGISRIEAMAMDPQQRLLLERGYEALHRAGLDKVAVGGRPPRWVEERPHCAPEGALGRLEGALGAL